MLGSVLKMVGHCDIAQFFLLSWGECVHCRIRGEGQWFDFSLWRVPTQWGRIKIAFVRRGILLPINGEERVVIEREIVGKGFCVVEVVESVKSSRGAGVRGLVEGVPRSHLGEA